MTPPHLDSEYLNALYKTRYFSSEATVEDLMKGLAACVSCAASGACGSSDKHEQEINNLMNRLAKGPTPDVQV